MGLRWLSGEGRPQTVYVRSSGVGGGGQWRVKGRADMVSEGQGLGSSRCLSCQGKQVLMTSNNMHALLHQAQLCRAVCCQDACSDVVPPQCRPLLIPFLHYKRQQHPVTSAHAGPKTATPTFSATCDASTVFCGLTYPLAPPSGSGKP